MEEMQIDRASFNSLTFYVCPGMQNAGKAEAGGTVPRMIELTDGWYCVKAVLDGPLKEQLERGRLQPGIDPLYTSGQNSKTEVYLHQKLFDVREVNRT